MHQPPLSGFFVARGLRRCSGDGGVFVSSGGVTAGEAAVCSAVRRIGSRGPSSFPAGSGADSDGGALLVRQLLIGKVRLHFLMQATVAREQVRRIDARL